MLPGDELDDVSIGIAGEIELSEISFRCGVDDSDVAALRWMQRAVVVEK